MPKQDIFESKNRKSLGLGPNTAILCRNSQFSVDRDSPNHNSITLIAMYFMYMSMFVCFIIHVLFSVYMCYMLVSRRSRGRVVSPNE